MEPWEAVILVEKELERIEQNEMLPLELAQRFIADSVYWYRHPKGGPAKAPKYSERIIVGPHGWEIQFGANSFLIDQAILRCNDNVDAVLGTVSNTHEKFSSSALQDRLINSVRSAVSNYLGTIYPTQWPITQGHMLFGTLQYMLASSSSAIGNLQI